MTSMRQRLEKELDAIRSGPVGHFCAGPVDEANICGEWRATILGPQGTPYEAGIFFLSLEFPTNYPFQPPQVRFVTKIFHVNVISDERHSRIDLAKLINTLNWIPVSDTVSTVLDSIYQLLANPNPNPVTDLSSPLRSRLRQPTHTDLFKYRRARFDQIARYWTLRFATGQVSSPSLSSSLSSPPPSSSASATAADVAISSEEGQLQQVSLTKIRELQAPAGSRSVPSTFQLRHHDVLFTHAGIEIHENEILSGVMLPSMTPPPPQRMLLGTSSARYAASADNTRIFVIAHSLQQIICFVPALGKVLCFIRTTEPVHFLGIMQQQQHHQTASASACCSDYSSSSSSSISSVLVAGTLTGRIILFDPVTLVELNRVNIVDYKGVDGGVSRQIVSLRCASSNFIVVGTFAGLCYCIRSSDLQIVWHQYAAASCAYMDISPDERTVAVGGRDGVTILSVADGSVVTDISVGDNYVREDFANSVFFLTPQRIVVSQSSREISVWDIPSGRRLAAAPADTGTSLSLSSDKARLLACGVNGASVAVLTITQE